MLRDYPREFSSLDENCQRTSTMNATRLTSDPLAQDLRPARPVLSGSARQTGGFLSNVVQTLLPFLSSGAKPALRRAEPRLQVVRSDGAGAADERREPHFFGQRRASPGTAD